MHNFKNMLKCGIIAVAIFNVSKTFGENLFQPLAESDRRDVRLEQHEPQYISVTRQRVKSSLVKGDTRTLTFNLEPQLIIDAAKTRAETTESGSLVWHGQLESQYRELRDTNNPSDDTVILVKRGDSITGTVRTGGRLFQIRPEKGGVHKIIEIDESRMPADHPAGAEERWERERLKDSHRQRDPSLYDAPEAAPDIRVLVAYTAKAKRAAGDINALIDLAVAETNTGYRNSGVNATMTLAHAYQVNYNENRNMDDDLDAIMGKNDGKMDEVHGRRDRHAADIVLMITDTDDGCGLASSIGANERNAFGIVRWSCATGYYSFGHEAGHLQSARHDPDTDSKTTPYAFGHGYRYPAGGWRTIMSYACRTGPKCGRINWWSNPNKRRGGAAMGTASRSNNARVLNLTASRVSNFRRGGGTTPPPPPTSGGFKGKVNLPGRIQAENYNSAPVESTSNNQNTAAITKCTYHGLGVDVQNSSGSTCNVGWTSAGEKLRYKVGSAGGRYNLGVRLASNSAGKRVQIRVNGSLVGTVTTPGNGWQSYTSKNISNVSVPSNATVEVTFVDGSANLDYINFARAGGTTPTPTQPPSSGNCIAVKFKERKELNLNNANCATFDRSLSGKTLAVWDSDSNASCDFRGTVTSVDGSGSLNVNANYVSSSSFTGNTIKFSNNSCKFVKVRVY